MKKHIILSACLALIYSCNNQEYMHEHMPIKDTIDMKNVALTGNPTLLSDFVSQINYFPIPTERDFLIGEVSKLIVTDSLFLIMDNQITHSAFVVSKTSDWKSCIHHHGNAPIEYLKLCDMFYNEETQELGVYCNLKSTILYYHLNGEYVRNQKIPYQAEMIQHVCDDKYLLHTTYRENKDLKKDGMFPNLIFANIHDASDIQCCNYFKKEARKDIVWCSNSWCSTWGDTVCFKPDHGNIVYHCTKDSIYPAHFLNFGSSNIDDRFWNKALENNITIEKLEEYCQQEKMYEIVWYLENENYIYFTYRKGNSLFHILYSKKTSRNFFFNKFTNDMDMYAEFRPKAILGSKLYGIISSHNIAKLRNILSGTHTPEALLKVEEGDNPVIIELTIKDF